MFDKTMAMGSFDSPFGVGPPCEVLDGKPADPHFVLHEVGYGRGNGDWKVTSVFSPFWRIYHGFESGHGVRFGGRETPLGPDRLLVIPSFQRFTCVGEVPVPSLWLMFSLELRVDPGLAMPIVIPKNRTIGALVHEFQAMFVARRPYRREAIHETGISFIHYVLSQPEITWQGPLPRRIASLLTLIRKDPAASWSNAALAREMHMNTDAFTRNFRQWMHDTPAKYVQGVRIRKACAMLTGSDLPIPRVATAVGFANRHHFSRVFKAHAGISPGQYRR